VRPVALAVAFALCAFPAAARATTITVSGPNPAGDPRIPVTITVAGGAGGDFVGVGRRDSDVLTISAPSGATFGGSLVAPGVCETQDGKLLHCQGFFVTRIEVDGSFGDGADGLTVPDAISGNSWPVTGGDVDMGDGSDSVNVVEFATQRAGALWTIHGGAGNDSLNYHDSFVEDSTSPATHDVIDGGGGDDRIADFAGTDDFVDGGPGDDFVEVDDDEGDGPAGGGSASGGAGTDTFETGVGDAPVVLRLEANGGVSGSGVLLPAAGSGFENLAADGVLDASVTLEGNDGPNVLTAHTSNATTLIGNGGDDVLQGGFAVDTFRGGPGDDRIVADDGNAESVDCGPGLDTDVRHDAQDALVDCEATPVVIASGPLGTVAAPDATFTFTAVGAPAGSTFQCQLDSGQFATCTSPRSFTALPDGPHVFRVRLVSNGTPSDASERAWTVDTTPPALTIDSAPAGDANPADVTIAFHADEPATFRCAIDGGAEADCASPLRLTGLAEGSHQVVLRALDAVGNASPPRTLGWGVAAVGECGADGRHLLAATCAAALPVDCPPGSERKVAFGLLVAVATTPASCFVPKPGNGGARQSPGPVLVNGVRVAPAAGKLVVLDSVAGSGRLETTGPYSLGVGSASIDLATPLTIDGLASFGSSLSQRAIKFLGGDLPKLLELPLKGEVKWDFATSDGGSSKLTLTVGLPNVFRPVPDGTIGPAPPRTVGGVSSTSGVSVTVIANASNDKGVSFAGKAKFSELYLFGKVKLKDVELGVDLGKRTFSGSAGISLAESGGANPQGGFGKDALLTVTMEIGEGGLLGTGLKKLTLAASQLEKFIGDGVYLQRMGGELAAGSDLFGRSAVVLSTTGGASLGPRLKLAPVFEGEAVSIDGTAKLMIPTDTPTSVSLQVEGIGKIVDLPVTGNEIAYTSPGHIETHGNIDATIAGFGLFAAIRSSWFDTLGLEFNVEATGGFRMPGLGAFGQLIANDREAEAVASTTGWAVCVGDNGERFGFGKRWGQSIQTFSDACDLGPFRRAQAAPAQAGGSRGFAVARGTGVLAIAARGAGAAPKLDVAGPRGAHAATPDGPEVADDAVALVVQDPATATTWVVLHHPAAGRWTVTPRAGSALARVDVADPLPPVRLTVRVTGHGRRRTLSWRMSRQPGQALTLTELGSRTPARTLVRTRRTRGRVAFATKGTAGLRRITAAVTRSGRPRLTRVVARYRSPAPARLRRVTAIRRRGATLRWKAQASADAYAVAVTPSGATTITTTVRTPRLKLPKAARRRAVTVTIMALSDDNRHGPVATRRLKT
jgi:hypothetical protein